MPTWVETFVQSRYFLLCRGYAAAMELSLLLIIIGIALAVLVHYGLGIALILIGLVLLIWPRLRGSSTTADRV